MKKIPLLTLSILLGISMAACGNSINSKTQEQDKIINSSQTAEAIVKSSFYFTANHNGISKIEAETNKLIVNIQAKGSVHNVQISPDGKTLAATLVPASGDGHAGHGETKGLALFYNAETNELIKQVDVGSHPAHIAFTENNKYALVTNNEDNNVSVIDLASYRVTHTIPTGKGPHGFRISPDSNYAYIANMGENTVSILNLANKTEVKKIKVGNTPVTTGITSDGKTLVTTLNAENSLAIIDLATERMDKVSVGQGPAQVYIQSNDQYAFVANQGTPEKPSTTISKIDLKTKSVVATIEVGKGAHGVVISKDNQYVYVTNMYEDTVSVIDNRQNKVIATLGVGEEPNGITIN